MYRFTGTETTAVYVDGVYIGLEPNKLYEADALVVKARPDLFSKAGDPVERATAAPGEKRQIRSGKKTEATVESKPTDPQVDKQSVPVDGKE